ncbi:MAG: error-prone DNA polymerase, partial [Myxococcota bacterium]
MFVELRSQTNASFLTGASTPEEMVQAASDCGYHALAVTDLNEVGGLVRAYTEASRIGMKLLVGTELTVVGPHGHDGAANVALIAKNRLGYARICRLLTRSKRSRPRGDPGITLDEITAAPDGLIALLTEPGDGSAASALKSAFGNDSALLVSRTFGPGEDLRLKRVRSLSESSGIQLAATGNALYHHPRRKPLADVLGAIRNTRPLTACGYLLQPNGERHIRPTSEWTSRFHKIGLGGAIDVGQRFAEQCNFSMNELRFVYPEKHLPAGETPISYFVGTVMAGARARYGTPIPEAARKQLEHELGLIERMKVEGFFLTMYDIVRFARNQGILCQGRGSAANSAVCYALGITSVDPINAGLLFERFLSEERGEPPDIDVDFEHERREEVIQYVYNYYGRENAGLVCENICYRPRSAVRDVGKALGLSPDQVDRLAKGMSHRSLETGLDSDRLVDAGIDPTADVAHQLRELVPQILGFPRHRGTHVGGMVVTHEPLIDTVPLEDAAMENRTILPWDKDDCDGIGMCKFDLLGLGILTCLRKCFGLVDRHYQRSLTLASVPGDCPDTYDRVCAGDTVGTFQIESRAQMSMLPRLRPVCFYDLVIAISIVRPGPIQGGMVHPYLRRRAGIDPITFPHPDLRPILSRTLGVPLFQEQVMRMAVEVAGFTPGEADELRRKMGVWRRRGSMGDVHDRLVGGMTSRGISADYAERIFLQIQGFGEYGFPESHAISFALLGYASIWLKTHYPAAYVCALLNSQPMGFY